MVYEVLFFKFGLKSRLYCTALIEFHSFSELKPSEEIRALSSLSGMFLGEMAPPHPGTHPYFSNPNISLLCPSQLCSHRMKLFKRASGNLISHLCWETSAPRFTLPSPTFHQLWGLNISLSHFSLLTK